MPECAVSILMVGVPPELAEIAAAGARLVWTAVDVEKVSSVEELEQQPLRRSRQIVVLGPAVPEGERGRVASTVGPDGLPRWPVLVFDDGLASGDLWLVLSPQSNPMAFANLVRLAVSQHEMRCDVYRARGDLWTIARRISHEMRSPLGCIMTSADVIREELADVVPAAAALAQPIVDSAHEVMELVDRLVLVAHASAQPPAPVAVDMSMVVWAARERLAVKIQQAEAEVVEPDDWPPVIAQREWLERIWQNLIGNALQHSGPRPRIEVGWKLADGETVFFVRDQGTGVPADVMPLLLRPFHQLHQRDSGRGLGLAIVQRLVELQGGRFGYEAIQPRGAHFFFTVPQGTSIATR